MNVHNQVRLKLLGGDGYGEQVFDEQELGEVQSQLEDLFAEATRGITDETSTMVLGVCRHIHEGTFQAIASRRGRGWRHVSALADRFIEIEGQALIHLAAGAHGQDLARLLPLKALSTELTLDKYEEFVNRKGSPKTQASMERILDRARENLELITDEMVKSYLAYATTTMRRARE
jgi:hypothetical protein